MTNHSYILSAGNFLLSLLILGGVSIIIFTVTLLLFSTKFTPLDISAIGHSQKYLEKQSDISKLKVLNGTPMENAKNAILKASKHYDVPVDLFLGIATAEASLTRFKGYNPWGIGNNGPVTYDSWSHSADSFAHLLRYYYLDEGYDTPEKIMPKYVGWQNEAWIKNVRQYWSP